jgi:hypothetical protein
MDLDFKALDLEAFQYLSNLGKISMAFDVYDWKELPPDNELKRDYEYYLNRRELWDLDGEPLSFIDYFINLSMLWRLNFIIKSLQRRTDYKEGTVIWDTVEILMAEADYLGGRLGL